MNTLVEAPHKKFWKNDKILLIMHETGLNALQLAEQVGISRSTLSHILAHRNKPSYEVLDKIKAWNPKYGFDWFSSETKEEVEKIKQLTDNQKYGGQKIKTEAALDFNEKSTSVRSTATTDSRSLQNRVEVKPMTPSVTVVEPPKQRKAIMVQIYYDDNTTQMIALDSKLNQLLGGMESKTTGQ